MQLRTYTYYWSNRLKQNSLFRDSFWALLGSAMGKGLALISGIIIARFLGKEIYGEFGTIRTTLTYVAIVSTFGFGYTATKYTAEYLQIRPDKIRKLIDVIYKITLAFSTILAIILFVFSDFISQYIEAPHLAYILKISSVIVIVNALNSTQIGILSGLKMFKELAKINVYAGIVTFITGIIFTYIWGLNGAIYSLLISFCFQVLLNDIALRRKLKAYTLKATVHVKEIKKMMTFSVPIALQESLYTVVHWLSILLLIKYANYGEVGLASAASLWQSLVIFIPSVLKNVMFSHLISSSDHEKIMNNLLLINFLSSVVPVIVVIVFSNFITSFYGDNFIGLSLVLIVNVLSAIFICLSEVYCYEFISIGKPWTVFTARLVRDIFILLIAYFVILNITTQQALTYSLVALGMNILFLIMLFVFYKKQKNESNIIFSN